VGAFQRRHGLKGEGVIGRDTRDALNLPPEQRVQQIAVSMERARWFGMPASGPFVEVDIAGFWLRAFRAGRMVSSMPVVVGTSVRQTPALDGRITSIIVNPTWTVPPTIVEQDILPRLRADPGYLAGRGIVRRSSPDGQHIRLIQPPGPTNPLGRYKFVMPNALDIYLHDSPDPTKFHRELRNFSSGCVRVGDAAGLAGFLLDGDPHVTPERLSDLVAAGRTRQIPLAAPVPVSLVYQTAWLDAEGALVLGGDPYGRDQDLWAALRKSRGVSLSAGLAGHPALPNSGAVVE
jgi:murein L,D-transpeptidase YcbB/YkuD